MSVHRRKGYEAVDKAIHGPAKNQSGADQDELSRTQWPFRHEERQVDRLTVGTRSHASSLIEAADGE